MELFFYLVQSLFVYRVHTLEDTVTCRHVQRYATEGREDTRMKEITTFGCLGENSKDHL